VYIYLYIYTLHNTETLVWNISECRAPFWARAPQVRQQCSTALADKNFPISWNPMIHFLKQNLGIKARSIQSLSYFSKIHINIIRRVCQDHTCRFFWPDISTKELDFPPSLQKALYHALSFSSIT
jgi:hypothetical protein